MRKGDYLIPEPNGDRVRVLVFKDVLVLPDQNWSMANFGSSISVEWLLYSGKLPGSRPRRLVLAQVLVKALDWHHGPESEPEGARP